MPIRFQKNDKNVIIKLITDNKFDNPTDDKDIMDMIEDLILEEAYDEHGNKCIVNSTECGSIIIRRRKHPFQDFLDIIIKKFPKMADAFGLDSKESNIERVEVIDILRKRTYDISEVK